MNNQNISTPKTPAHRRSILAAATLTIAAASGCDGLRTSFDTYERDLLGQFRMGDPPADDSNIYSGDPAVAELGHRLFFETEMSGPLGPANADVTAGAAGLPGESGKLGCFSCHDLNAGGADRRSRPATTSLGAGWTTRNTPTVLNAAYSPRWMFWDGRVDSLWGQAIAALEGPATHNSTRLQVAHTIYRKYRIEYESLFEPLPPELADTSTASRFPPAGKPGQPAFDNMSAEDKETINRIIVNVAKSIAAYERLLVCNNSPFDRWLDGDESAMSPAAVRGMRLFIGRAACLECHLGPAFTDFEFHNTGSPRAGQYSALRDEGRAEGLDKLKNFAFGRASIFSDSMESPHPAGERTPGDVGRFKTPSLRCVAQTAPYKHDGAYETLLEVARHYNAGGSSGTFLGEKDVALQPLFLDDAELGELVEFLQALTGAPLPESLTAPPG